MLPGKRLCAGETYARHTMFLIVSTLIQNFTVKLAPGKPLPSEEPDMPGIIVTKKEFWLKFEPRAWHSLNPHYRLLFCGQRVKTSSGCWDICQGLMQHEEMECIIFWLAELHESLSINSPGTGILDYTTVRILWDFPLLYLFVFYPIQATCSTHPTPQLNPYNIWWEAANVTVLY